MKRIFLIITLLLCLPNAYAEPVKWSNYAGLLLTHVQPGEKNGVQVNLVDYSAWKADPRRLKVLRKLENFDLSILHTKDEKLAFWINTYNIMAIEKVLSHWPIESIRDEGNFFNSVWKQPVIMVAGKIRSLNEIEHHILRPMGQPLIHVAIVCASVSCPDLRREPYTAENLQAQLQAQATDFLANADKGLYVDADGLHISSIFVWFEDDFGDEGVVAWLHQYRKDIRPDAKIVSYLPYDWYINAL